jgi:hypothetical protein
VRAHLHTAAQAVGILVALVGAYLIAGPAGDLVVGGLVVAAVSVFVEASGVRRVVELPEPVAPKPPKSFVGGEGTAARSRVVGPDSAAERLHDVPPGLWSLEPEKPSQRLPGRDDPGDLTRLV